MIRIKFDANEKTKLIKMTVDGHAGYAERGEDIVCSAVSILAYTIAQAVDIMNTKGMLAKPPAVEMDSGKMFVSCRAADAEAFSKIMSQFVLIQLGCSLIKNTYPDNVQLTTFIKP